MTDIHQKYRVLFNIPSEQADLIEDLRIIADKRADNDAPGYSYHSVQIFENDDDFVRDYKTVVFEYRGYYKII